MSDKSTKKEGGVGVLDKQKNKLQPPKKYKVIMYNDDYTPMEFVVLILMQLFHKTGEAANSVMLNVHNSGKGIAGVFSKEIAETKVREVNDVARSYGHPLKCELEAE
tara:strand:- start:26 stop:346 length:321 start_codon:yes stop_codon:yes gene_type:complete